MKGLSAHLFSALSVICIIALVVFLVQVIAQNNDDDTQSADAVITEIPTEQSSGSDVLDSQGGFGVEGAFVPSPTERPPPQGMRYLLPVDPDTGTTLVIYAQEEIFDFINDGIDWRFEHRGGGDVGLTIRFAYMSPQGGGGAEAEAFLNKYLDDEIASYKGQYAIADSDISGFNASAQKDGSTYEVWLYRLPSSDLALAFLINYEFNNQRDDLYTILSTLDILEG